MTAQFIVSRAAATAVLLVLATAGLAQTLPSAQFSQKSGEAAEIATVAAQRGFSRIIVEFAQPVPTSQLKPDPVVLAPVKDQVRASQDAILATHFRSAADPAPGPGFDRSVRRLEISPMLGLNATMAEIEALALDPRVVRIHYDRPVPYTLDESVPLVGMTGTGGAYALGATGSGQAVAVLDTGVQRAHPFLTAAKVISEACFSTNSTNIVSLCPNGSTSQAGTGAAEATTSQCLNGGTNLCTHGSHVAGIAAGYNTSGSNPANGVARNGSIVAVQVFTRFNSSTDCTNAGTTAPCVLSYTSDQIFALNWVYTNLNSMPGGVKIASINMSLGGGGYTGYCDSDSRKSIIDSLRSAGVATVIASGNSGFINAVGAPGCISTAVTVGSSTKQDAISSFSNMASMVDLMAPGSSIYSSIPSNTYAYYSGTSMATPHVAGAFAAIRTAAPNATVDQIETALKNTGTSIVDNRSGGTQTKPRIRVDLALGALGVGASTLVVSPSTNMSSSGNVGGPFAPSSFQYQLSATSGSVNFSISGLQSWLSASSTSGTVTTSPTTITFTVNSNANALSASTYTSTITFTNTTNGNGNTTRTATLIVNAAGATSNDNFASAATIHLNQTKTAANAAATKESGEPVHAGNSGGKSLWWNFQAAASGPVRIATTGSNFDTLLAVYTGNTVNALSSIAANDDIAPGSDVTSQVAFSAVVGTIYRIAVDGYNYGSGAASGNIQLGVFDNSSAQPTWVVSAVAPNARTTTIGVPVTAFGTTINGGSVSATSCSLALPSGVPANFLYQTTNPSTNQPTGSPNTPVNIGAGQSQSFYFAVTPTSTFAQDLAIIFDCTNTNPASVVSGLNTLLVTANSSAIPDMVSISDTLSHDGKIDISGANGTGLMVVASVNIGAAGTVTFTPTDTPFGQLANNLPLTKTICQTNPSTGACMNPVTPGSSSTVTVTSGQTVYFSVFVQGQGASVPYDPANNRIFAIASQGSTPVGAASAAVNMTP